MTCHIIKLLLYIVDSFTTWTLRGFARNKVHHECWKYSR